MAEKDVEAGELLCRLARERGAILRESAACDEQRHCPRQHADRKSHRAAEERAGAAAPRAIQQHHAEQRKRQPDRLCAGADCETRDERANHNQPARLGDSRRMGSVRHSPPDQCRRKARLRGQCHAQPRHVAQRAKRSEPEERRGDDDNRREHGTAIAFHRIRRTIQGFDASKQRHEGKHRQRAEHRSPHRQRAGLGRRNRMRQFAEGDEDRISRRVRLMFRRIEVAHAKRKVHRVEVFERRRQKGQVRDQKHRGESGGPKARGRGFHKGVFKTHRMRRRAPPVFAVLS